MPNQLLKNARRPVEYTGSGSAIANYMSGNPEDGKDWGRFDAKNKRHRQILSLVRQLQLTVPNARHGEVADMSGAFAKWLKSDKAPVQKPLMEMTDHDLSTTIVALEGWLLWKFGGKKQKRR